jgi:hypothetical protein
MLRCMIRLFARELARVPGAEAEALVVYTIRRGGDEDFVAHNPAEAADHLTRLGVDDSERLIEQVRHWRAVEIVENDR